MKIRSTRLFGVALICSCSAMAGTSSSAPGAAGGAAAVAARAPTVTFVVPAQQQAAATALWTRETVAATPALPMLIDYGYGAPDAIAPSNAAAFGPEQSKPSGAAAPGAASVARAAFAADWNALKLSADAASDAASDAATDVAAAGIPAGTAAAYTTYDVNTRTALWKIYPHLWYGKLTFSTPSGGASCSATVLAGNNIVTAAHCVYDTTANKWYSNWVFTPAYRNGAAPYGTFAATSCTILTNWVSQTGSFSINTWTKYDVAVCTMGTNSAGQTLNAAVGWSGRTWNAGYNQLVFNSGYPAQNYNLVGIGSPAQYLRSCTAETFTQTTDTLGMGCNWGPGISGGSWSIGYKPFVGGSVNSVNSGLYAGQQAIYGIRFNSANIVPLCTARGC